MAIVEEDATSLQAGGGCMMHLRFSRSVEEPLQVLCIGAHSDDIEIGCGGSLLQLKEWYPQLAFHWVVLTATGERRAEACRAAQLFTEDHSCNVMLQEFEDGFLPYSAAEVKRFFERLKALVEPDIIFTHWGGDAHQDHRLTSEMTWNTFRNHAIFEYEIPKYDGDLGRPNCFVPLDNVFTERKIEHLLDVFASQRNKRWFERDMFLGLMRLRGMECNAASGHAEAFHVRKLVMGCHRSRDENGARFVDQSLAHHPPHWSL
jgi:LmbE family N-acetylglucosaminyl deacetylase